MLEPDHEFTARLVCLKEGIARQIGPKGQDRLKTGFLGLASPLVSTVLRTHGTYMAGGVIPKKRIFRVL